MSLCPGHRGGRSITRTFSSTREEAFSGLKHRQPGPLLALLYRHSSSAGGTEGSECGPK